MSIHGDKKAIERAKQKTDELYNAHGLGELSDVELAYEMIMIWMLAEIEATPLEYLLSEN